MELTLPADSSNRRGFFLTNPKVLGLIVERRHHAIKPIEQMNEQELFALLGENDTGAH